MDTNKPEEKAMMVMRMVMCITGAVFVSKSEIYLGASGRGGE
jgi:hypothetical protein